MASQLMIRIHSRKRADLYAQSRRQRLQKIDSWSPLAYLQIRDRDAVCTDVVGQLRCVSPRASRRRFNISGFHGMSVIVA